jgi:hypothetical protein
VLEIITTSQWGARPPKHPIVLAGRPKRVIEHHTAGHAPELDHVPGESYFEARAYVRAVQNFHMDVRGWNDTGQNFLVARSGDVFEGRHGSVDAILHGRMVESAHCPFQNDQPGIEHEHYGDEQLTSAQKRASIELHVWICRHTGIKPTEFDPHRKYFATACPTDSVAGWLPTLELGVAAALRVQPPHKQVPVPAAFWLWVAWRRGDGIFAKYGPRNKQLRPPVLPTRIPQRWWAAYKNLGGDRG